VVKLKSSLRKFYGHHNYLVNRYEVSVSQMICSVCRNHNQNRKGPDCDYHRGVERVTRRVSHVKQELFTLPEHLSSPPIFSEVRVARSLVFNVMLCRPLFVLLSFFFWPLYCLFFFDLRLLITSLWYLLAIVLSVLLRFTACDYSFGNYYR
jgi:hypothetical protein